MAETPRSGEQKERSARIKRKARARARARCFRGGSGLFTTAAISSPSSHDERGVRREVKDGDIASLCARTPFPPFIYLRLPRAAAGDARISLPLPRPTRESLFSRLFHYPPALRQFTPTPPAVRRGFEAARRGSSPRTRARARFEFPIKPSAACERSAEAFSWNRFESGSSARTSDSRIADDAINGDTERERAAPREGTLITVNRVAEETRKLIRWSGETPVLSAFTSTPRFCLVERAPRGIPPLSLSPRDRRLDRVGGVGMDCWSRGCR